MRLIILFFFAFCLWTGTYAGVLTQTHMYVPSMKENCVIVIELATNNQIKIPVGKEPIDMVIDRGKGFVTNEGDGTITVIDLNTHTVLHTIILKSGCLPLVIMAHKGYVLSALTKELIEVDLNTYTMQIHGLINARKPISLIAHQVSKRDMLYIVDSENEDISYQDVDDFPLMNLRTIPVGKDPQPMQIYDGTGYVVNRCSGTVTVIDLHRNFPIQIEVGKYPDDLKFYKNFGFISCQNDQKVVVLDLKTNTVIKEISTQSSPFYLTLHNNKGYIITLQKHIITVFDLDTLEIKKKIKVNKTPTAMLFHDGVGYVVNHVKKLVSLLNLKEYKWIDHIKNPTNDPVYFSKTHLYFGANKVRILPPQKPKGPLSDMIFFDKPYEGIFGGIGGSHEEAFASMIAAIEHHDYEHARKKFNEAMAYGSPKAYAIGAVAFKLGIWGAPKNMKRYLEFLVPADVPYLWELYNLYS